MKTKEKADALIDYLASYCELVKDGKYPTFKTTPVMIGNVMAKIRKLPPRIEDCITIEDDGTETGGTTESDYNFWIDELVFLYEDCGFNKSINEIFDGERIIAEYPQGTKGGMFQQLFKDSNTQKLLDFLWDLFGEEITKSK